VVTVMLFWGVGIAIIGWLAFKIAERCEGTGGDGRSSGTRSSLLSRIFDDQDRRRPMPRHGDLASPADDPVRAPAATAAPSAIACSPRP